MSKSFEEAMAVIKDYLYSQNRPYSLNDIINNLQNKFNKSTATKVLESLVSSSEICEKINGKQKIYFANQLNFETDQQKLKDLDSEITELSKEVNCVKQSITEKQQKIRTLKEHVSTEDMENRLKLLRDEVEELSDSLASVTSRCKNVDPGEHSNLKRKHSTLTEECRKRRRLCNQVVDMILENYPKSKKCFYEEVGLETDEDVIAK